jgi:hypothetical protein
VSASLETLVRHSGRNGCSSDDPTIEVSPAFRGAGVRVTKQRTAMSAAKPVGKVVRATSLDDEPLEWFGGDRSSSSGGEHAEENLASLILFATVLPAACVESDYDDEEFRGGQPPIVCTACTYKTASFTVSSSDLNGGMLVSATMRTDVDHSTCPYSGYASPCDASSDFDVTCKYTGPGTYKISYSPNGISSGSRATASVDLVVSNGGVLTTVRKAVTLGSPVTSTQPTTLPCGGTPVIDIVD